MTGRYAVLLTPPARRALAELLPPGVAAAAWELITGALADDPWRVGKPLHGPYEGLHAARRGTYRVLYKMLPPDEAGDQLARSPQTGKRACTACCCGPAGRARPGCLSTGPSPASWPGFACWIRAPGHARADVG